MEVKVINGKWSSENQEPLNVLELRSLPKDLNRVCNFIGDKEITPNRVEILLNILDINEQQEEAILRIFELNNKQIKLIV